MKYREVFPKPNTFLAVIHALDSAHATRNAIIARDNGADGVFLINHSISPSALIKLYAVVRTQLPEDYWMGMNLLTLDRVDALSQLPDDECGLWVDDAGVRGPDSTSEAETFAEYRATRVNWRGIYFGGVAFKYQEAVVDPAAAAAASVPYVDVITTSGIGTGFAPSVEKIKAMKAAIGDHPLAIASGITPENVHLFKDFADCVLVATGISRSDTELDPRKVAALATCLE